MSDSKSQTASDKPWANAAELILNGFRQRGYYGADPLGGMADHAAQILDGYGLLIGCASSIPFVGTERDNLIALNSDARTGEPLSRDAICDVCEGAVRALERLTAALAGAIHRAEAAEAESNAN